MRISEERNAGLVKQETAERLACGEIFDGELENIADGKENEEGKEFVWEYVKIKYVLL